MTSVPRVTPISTKEIPGYRRDFWIGWVLGIAGVLFAVSAASPGTPFFSPTNILLLFLSVPTGWFLGYKKLIAPLFVGGILIDE